MQSLIKKIFTVILITLILSCSLIPALAATLPDINAKTTRIATLSPINNCKSTQSLSVTSTGENNRLFVVRLNADNPTIATLYMYKNYKSMNNSESDEYGTFILSDFVGHANGMAIDDNYIYISCWDNTNSDNGRKIARISRSKLWLMYNGTNDTAKGTLTENSDGVTILTAEYENGNVYDKNIFGITYYKDGKFIIMTLKTTDNENGIEYYNFTTGSVVNNKLIVSDDSVDKFQVAFEMVGTSGQDIGYDPDCGFFITRFIEGTQNAIIWVKLNSLSGENRVYTADNSNYRIIRVNKSSEIFALYELEAVSIGSDNYMYASVNVHLQEGATYPNYQKDPIIKIERPTEVNETTKFLGNNITL